MKRETDDKCLILYIKEGLGEERKLEDGNVPVVVLRNKEQAKNFLDAKPKTIWLETKDGATKVFCKNILYGEKEKYGVTIVTRDRVIRNIKCGLDDLIKKLDDKEFCRCHKSFFLNMDQVIGIKVQDNRQRDAIFDFEDKRSCPIGISYYKEIKQKIVR